MSMTAKTPLDEEENSEQRAKKKQRRESSTSRLVVLQSGVFWDIENIPVKKTVAERKIPEIKQAIIHFVTCVNHYNDDSPTVKNIRTFMAVARQKGEETIATTADFIKTQLIHNQIELLDLPYKSDPDYCDDAIYHQVLCFTEEHGRSMVVALTGDVGLVRRINSIDRDFDLIVVMQRAGKKTAVMQRHCDKIKQTNERGRQQAVYFIDEVVRKCTAGGIPLTFSQLLRQKSGRHKVTPLENNHLRLLFGDGGVDDQETEQSTDSAYGSSSEQNISESDDDSWSESGLFTDVDSDY